jgi:hypothetical protein
MTDIDLSGDIQVALDDAGPSGHAPVLAYVDDAGAPSISYRGSVHVHGRDQIALWSRQPDGALVQSIAQRPTVSLLYYSRDTPGAFYLSIRGRARVAPELNDTVYGAISQRERDADADRNGVAILVDVDSVVGAAPDGPISQQRGA